MYFMSDTCTERCRKFVILLDSLKDIAWTQTHWPTESTLTIDQLFTLVFYIIPISQSLPTHSGQILEAK